MQLVASDAHQRKAPFVICHSLATVYKTNSAMKRILLTIIAILTTELLLAQPVPIWSSSINSNFVSYVHDKPKMKFDNAGDLILVGNIDNSANGFGIDILLAKYSPSGSIIWQQLFNGANNLDDAANDFEIDFQNNILITGQSKIDSVNTDLITVKYFSNGNFDWLNSFNGTTNREDNGTALTVDQTGSSFVTGFTSIKTLGHSQIIATKIDSGGSTLWTQFYGTDTTALYQGKKIKLINNEVRIIASSFSLYPFTYKFIVLKFDTIGTLQFSKEGFMNPPASCFYLDNIGNSYLGFGGYERFKFFKINSTGSIAWMDSITTNLPFNVLADEARAIIVDSLQNVYITGRHYGDDYGGPTYSNADILTMKYSSNGIKLWSKRYEYQGNNAADVPNAITLDNNLNVYVAGQSERELTDYDYVVVKYDINGNELGTIRFNDTASGDDAITSILVDDSSNIYVTGLTFDTLLSRTTTQKYSSVSGVGIFEVTDSPISVNAFPNPFSNSTCIQFTNTENEVFNLQVFDISGKIIFNEKTTDNKIEISSHNLPTGLYLFMLISGKGIYNGKIIRSK